MITIEQVRAFALSLPEAVEKEHFDKPSFRVKDKIFATLWIPENRAMLKLNPTDQSVFCSYKEGTVFFPVPGGWGKQGATFVDLKQVRQDMFKDAMTVAYCGVAPKKMAEALKRN